MSSKYGPIILIEDDAEDHNFLVEAYKGLNRRNELRLYTNAREVLDYLMTTNAYIY